MSEFIRKPGALSARAAWLLPAWVLTAGLLGGCLNNVEAHGSTSAKAQSVATSQNTAAQTTKSRSQSKTPDWPAPKELYPVVRVVDGDTVHIERKGKIEKLRLLSVDTEEKLSFKGSASKPGTVFGEETTVWAKEYFDAWAKAGEPAQIGLLFPPASSHGSEQATGASEQREARDVYGRLLCHVIMPDGTDFNLELVRQGWSPYFNKYGHSLIARERFAAAQKEARAKQLGVWNPKTNRPKDSKAPTASRPYAKLLPWWQQRAEAVQHARELFASKPGTYLSADDPKSLTGATAEEVQIFGLIDRVFEEDDGSTTVLMRSGDKRQSLRLIVPAKHQKKFPEKFFARFQVEFEQNYLWVQGQLKPNTDRGGFLMTCQGPEAFRQAK